MTFRGPFEQSWALNVCAITCGCSLFAESVSRLRRGWKIEKIGVRFQRVLRCSVKTAVAWPNHYNSIMLHRSRRSLLHSDSSHFGTLLLFVLSSLVAGLFFLALLFNQRWSPPLRLQVSHCSTFRIVCDVPSIIIIIAIIIIVITTTMSVSRARIQWVAGRFRDVKAAGV